MRSALLVVLLLTPGAQPDSSAPAPPDFEREIRPLLESACLACHSGAVVQADLRMDSREALLRGGVSGPAVVPGRSAQSLLMKRIRGEGSLPRMPMGRTLEETEVQALAAWIDAALDRETPFKCTAGLHHAVRHTGDDGFEHHGFLNVLVATRQAFDGASADDVAAILEQRDADALVGDAGELERARRWFTSFGSCSVTEPLDDLIALGLLEKP